MWRGGLGGREVGEEGKGGREREKRGRGKRGGGRKAQVVKGKVGPQREKEANLGYVRRGKSREKTIESSSPFFLSFHSYFYFFSLPLKVCFNSPLPLPSTLCGRRESSAV